MIHRAVPRASRHPLKPTALRDRAKYARRYLAEHRRGGVARELEVRGFGLRWFATALVLVVGILLAQQAVTAVAGAFGAITATIDEFFPTPVIDRGPQAPNAPNAPNAAPILDPIEKVTKDSRLVVSGRLQSFTLGGSVAAKVEIALNGSLAASPAVDADGKFNATIALANGTNTIVVTMIRGSERAAALPRTIVLDTTPPTLTLTAPPEGAALEGPSIRVTGKTELGASVTVNGHGTSVTADGSFTDTVPAGVGPLTLDIVVRDQAGNETKKSVKITVLAKGGTGTAFVSVALSNPTAKIGTPVMADVFVSDQGLPLAFAAISVNVGVTQVANGRTDGSGRFHVTFTAPAPDGTVQVVAFVNGTSSGSASLTVTK